MQKTLTTQLGLVLAALLASASLLLMPQTANAHDVLTGSTPETGSTVETSPDEVRLQFSGQPLSGQGLTNLIRVTDDQGNQWQDGEVAVEGYDIAIDVCDDLPQGEYTVAYRVVYSDGHTGEESFTFTNADPSAPEEGTPQDCGEASAQDSEGTAVQDNDTAATSDANEAADENTSASFPVWLWVVGGVGVVVIAGIVVLLMRGGRAAEQSEESADD